MTNKELVRNFLQQEGYKFEETANVFRFKAQGLNLVCEATERDPMFIYQDSHDLSAILERSVTILGQGRLNFSNELNA